MEHITKLLKTGLVCEVAQSTTPADAQGIVSTIANVASSTGTAQTVSAILGSMWKYWAMARGFTVAEEAAVHVTHGFGSVTEALAVGTTEVIETTRSAYGFVLWCFVGVIVILQIVLVVKASQFLFPNARPRTWVDHVRPLSWVCLLYTSPSPRDS